MYIEDDLIVAGWGRVGKGQDAAQVLMKAAVSARLPIHCRVSVSLDKVIMCFRKRERNLRSNSWISET